MRENSRGLNENCKDPRIYFPIYIPLEAKYCSYAPAFMGNEKKGGMWNLQISLTATSLPAQPSWSRRGRMELGVHHVEPLPPMWMHTAGTSATWSWFFFPIPKRPMMALWRLIRWLSFKSPCTWRQTGVTKDGPLVPLLGQHLFYHWIIPMVPFYAPKTIPQRSIFDVMWHVYFYHKCEWMYWIHFYDYNQRPYQLYGKHQGNT